MTRFWQICNNVLDFKHATTQLTLRLFLRGHAAQLLMKGWNKFVHRHHRRSSLVNVKLTQWFRSMVKWALYHPLHDPSMETSNRANANTPTPPPQQQTSPSSPPTCSTRKRCRDISSPLHSRPAKKSRKSDDDTMLCGLHALNACLRAYGAMPVTLEALKRICADLDRRERAILDDRSYRALARSMGTNRTSHGFTLQALQYALLHANIRHEQVRDVHTFIPPSTCRAFLLHVASPAPIGHFLAVVNTMRMWQLYDNEQCGTPHSNWSACLENLGSTTQITCTYL